MAHRLRQRREAGRNSIKSLGPHNCRASACFPGFGHTVTRGGSQRPDPQPRPLTPTNAPRTWTSLLPRRKRHSPSPASDPTSGSGPSPSSLLGVVVFSLAGRCAAKAWAYADKRTVVLGSCVPLEGSCASLSLDFLACSLGIHSQPLADRTALLQMTRRFDDCYGLNTAKLDWNQTWTTPRLASWGACLPLGSLSGWHSSSHHNLAIQDNRYPGLGRSQMNLASGHSPSFISSHKSTGKLKRLVQALAW